MDWNFKKDDWNIEDICSLVRSRIDMSKEVTDEEVLERIDQVILQELRMHRLPLQKKTQIREMVFCRLRRLDVLQEYLDDPTVTEIMVNGHQKIFIEREGKLILTDKRFDSKERYEDVVMQLVADSNRVVNRTNPIVDVRTGDGFRVNIILEPIALDGTSMTIRKFADKHWNEGKLIELGTLTKDMAEMFCTLVKAKYNIIVSGGTGSGKTTFLNFLSGFIPEEERIITIEDSAELRLRNLPNLVRLETRNDNVEGEHAIDLKDLIRASMRLRPDRLIVGEVRGEETFYMLNGAMNTGHDGSLSTCHANSCKDTISRLETMVLTGCEIPIAAIQRQIGSAIDLIVHMGRLRDHSRKILEVTEVYGGEAGEVCLNPIFLFQEKGEENGKIVGNWAYCNALKQREKLKLSGYEKQLKSLERKFAEGQSL